MDRKKTERKTKKARPPAIGRGSGYSLPPQPGTKTDLTGLRFSRLLVIERRGSDKHGKAIWLCRCDCGKAAEVITGDLRSGKTKSCGCWASDWGRMSVVDLTGKRFGRLTVIERAESKKIVYIEKKPKYVSLWSCKCECGTKITLVFTNSDLQTGNVRSCGCLRKEVTSQRRSGNLVGERFGRLIVRSRAGSNQFQKALWLCDCDCGRKTTAATGDLRSGHTQSCGCFQVDRSTEGTLRYHHPCADATLALGELLYGEVSFEDIH